MGFICLQTFTVSRYTFLCSTYHIVAHWLKQVEAENHCTSQMRLLIDQISVQQGQIVTLQGSCISQSNLF